MRLAVRLAHRPVIDGHFAARACARGATRATEARLGRVHARSRRAPPRESSRTLVGSALRDAAVEAVLRPRRAGLVGAASGRRNRLAEAPFQIGVDTAAFGEHDVGPVRATFANALAGTLIGLASAEQLLVSTGMLPVVAPTPHVASPVRVSVKLPLPHEPPTSVHEHEQLGVPSPLTTRRSVLFVPSGQERRDESAKITGVQPAGTA